MSCQHVFCFTCECAISHFRPLSLEDSQVRLIEEWEELLVSV